MAAAKSKSKEGKGPGGYELALVGTLLPEGVEWEDLKVNLEDLDEVPIPRIKFDSSEAAFYLNEDDEDEEPVKEFEGVILSYFRQNTYWSTGYDPNDRQPPECVSLDGKTGSVYGACKPCQYNQFGSALQGKGKACRNQIKVYIHLDGRAIPQRLFLSPTNLRAFTRAFMVGQVSQKGLAFWKVRAKFTGYKNKKETFGRVKISVVGVFKGEELEGVRKIREFWLPFLEANHYAAGNFNSPSAEDEDEGSSTSSSSNESDATPDESEETSTPKEVKPRSKKVEIDEDEEPPF